MEYPRSGDFSTKRCTSQLMGANSFVPYSRIYFVPISLTRQMIKLVYCQNHSYSTSGWIKHNTPVLQYYNTPSDYLFTAERLISDLAQRTKFSRVQQIKTPD
jgi:hypothetical protein